MNNLNYTTNVEFSVELLKFNPISTPADEGVLLYFHTERKNIDYDKTIILLYMKVSEELLNKSGVDAETVNVYGYSNSNKNWTIIPSIKQNNIYSFVVLNNFNLYAIGGKSLPPQIKGYYVVCGTQSYYFNESESVSFECKGNELWGKWSKYFEWIPEEQELIPCETTYDINNNNITEIPDECITQKQFDEMYNPSKINSPITDINHTIIGWTIIGMLVFIGYYLWQRKK